MFTFYASEVGQQLVFDVLLDSAAADLAGVVIELVVAGLTGSPFICVNDLPGARQARYVVQSGDFPAGVYSAYLRYTKAGVVLRTDDFTITSLA